jgi:hypothetical protein
LSNPFRGVPLRGVGVVVVGLGEDDVVVGVVGFAADVVVEGVVAAAFGAGLEGVVACVGGGCCLVLGAGGVEVVAACVVWDVGCAGPDLAAGTPWFIGGSFAKDCIGMVIVSLPKPFFPTVTF